MKAKTGSKAASGYYYHSKVPFQLAHLQSRSLAPSSEPRVSECSPPTANSASTGCCISCWCCCSCSSCFLELFLKPLHRQAAWSLWRSWCCRQRLLLTLRMKIVMHSFKAGSRLKLFNWFILAMYSDNCIIFWLWVEVYTLHFE